MSPISLTRSAALSTPASPLRPGAADPPDKPAAPAVTPPDRPAFSRLLDQADARRGAERRDQQAARQRSFGAAPGQMPVQTQAQAPAPAAGKPARDAARRADATHGDEPAAGPHRAPPAASGVPAEGTVCEAPPMSAEAPGSGEDIAANGANDASAMLAAIAAWDFKSRATDASAPATGSESAAAELSAAAGKDRLSCWAPDVQATAGSGGGLPAPSSVAAGYTAARLAEAAEAARTAQMSQMSQMAADQTAESAAGPLAAERLQAGSNDPASPGIPAADPQPGFAAALSSAASAAGFATPATAPVAEARIAATPGTPEFAQQLGLQVSVFVQGGVEHAVLELHPVEMGPLTVQIRLDGQTAQVHLAADWAPTREALEQALPTLAGTLQEAGITLSGGGVSEQPRPSQAPPNGRGDGGSSASPGDRSRGDADRGGRSGSMISGEGGAVPQTALRRGLVDLVA